jgi:hypothetical protein
MNESFSRVRFLCGMAFVLAVGKTFTLLIWHTLPKLRPPLQQEIKEASGSEGGDAGREHGARQLMSPGLHDHGTLATGRTREASR